MFRPQLFTPELLHDRTIAGNHDPASSMTPQNRTHKYTLQLWINGHKVGSTNPQPLNEGYSVDICEIFRYRKYVSPAS